ncbi:hypothetical protein GCM10009696_36560 [Kocuria himachalensis]
MLRVLIWAVVLVLAFAAALWALFVTAPEGGGALIGAPLIAMLGPLLLSVPLAFVQGRRAGQQAITYMFWPMAYLVAVLLGTPVLVWWNGWFTPEALPPGQALRDIIGAATLMGVLAVAASAVTVGAAGAGAGIAGWLRRDTSPQVHP